MITVITIDEIVKVVQGTSGARTLFSGRPRKRITIYSKADSSEETTIDVSLQHFKSEDILKLTQIIQQKRPDLIMPNIIQ